MADPSFDIHPKTKGSYRRRAEDIDRALRDLRLEGLSRETTLLIYYFACEKLAKIIIGVSTKKPASHYFERHYSSGKAGCKVVVLFLEHGGVFDASFLKFQIATDDLGARFRQGYQASNVPL